MTSVRFPFLLAIAALFLAIPVPAQPGKAVAGLRTVIIDAGHGGTDAGCISADKKVYEKNITLDIAKRLATKIAAEYPEVTVKLTRSDDRFIKLQDRGKFANDAGGDLFISIHVNSTDKGTSANGYSVHCLGKSSNKNRDIFNENLNLVKRENAVVKLEKDYKTTYQGYDPDDPESSIIFTLMQNAHLTNSLDFASRVLEERAHQAQQGCLPGSFPGTGPGGISRRSHRSGLHHQPAGFGRHAYGRWPGRHCQQHLQGLPKL